MKFPGNKKESVALSSVFASAGLTVIKLLVGLSTGSMGIISEAAHSALDLGAASLTYFAVRVSDKPADKEHPYGHGKIENISAFVETGLLFITSAWIVYEAVHRLMLGTVEVEVRWYSFAVIIFAIIVDFSRSRSLAKVAKETNSQALEADALHFSSDILSSGVVLLGLILVSFGIKGADSLAAIGVAIFVIFAGINLGKRTVAVLVDTAPAGMDEKISGMISRLEGVLKVNQTRVRPTGPSVSIDMEIVVNRQLSFENVQKIIKTCEKTILKVYPEADVSVKAKPMALNTETITDKIQMIASNRDIPIHDIVIYSIEGKKSVNFHIELDNKFSVQEADLEAEKLEKEIKKELGEDILLNIHIEPTNIDFVEGKNIEEKEIKKIEAVFEKIRQKEDILKGFHDLQIMKVKNKYFVSVHCTFQSKTSLSEAHESTSRIETEAKELLPDLQRVVMHIESI